MSPFFVPIILAIFLSFLFLVIGVVTRKRKLIFIRTPATALLLALKSPNAIRKS